MIIVCFLIALLFVLICISAFDATARHAFDYQQYSSFDELASYISESKNTLDLLKKEGRIDSDSIKIYQKKINVGEFLIKNEIEYDYLSHKVTDNELSLNSTELFDAISVFGLFASVILIVLMMVFSIMTLNHDLNVGVARLLFALGKTRKQILKDKYSAYMASLGCVLIVFSFIIMLVVIPYKINFEKVLIVDNSNVYMIDISAYLAICIFSILLLILFFSTVIFSIAMCIRGIYTAIFLNIIFTSGYLLTMTYSNGILASFTNEWHSYNLGSANLGLYIALYLIRLLLAVGFFLISSKIFLKRDIY
jgi:hypothetical protein